MDPDFNKSASKESSGVKQSGKYVTLAFLLIWVAAVFVFTFFNFSGGGR